MPASLPPEDEIARLRVENERVLRRMRDRAQHQLIIARANGMADTTTKMRGEVTALDAALVALATVEALDAR